MLTKDEMIEEIAWLESKTDLSENELQSLQEMKRYVDEH